MGRKKYFMTFLLQYHQCDHPYDRNCCNGCGVDGDVSRDTELNVNGQRDSSKWFIGNHHTSQE
uniref:Uncharacterized protein n=1 Tax=Parascaris univalens TaxID=6257 RepID=A0A915AUE3_PARUN